MTTVVRLGISPTFGPVFSLIQTDKEGIVRLMDGTWPDDTKEVAGDVWHEAADAVDADMIHVYDGYFAESQAQSAATKTAMLKLKALGFTAREINAMVGGMGRADSAAEIGLIPPKIQRPPTN